MGVNDLGCGKGGGGCAVPSRAQPGKPGNGSNQQNRSGNRKPAPSRNTDGNGGSGRGIETRTDFLAETNGSAFVKTAALQRRAQRFLSSQSRGAFAAGFEVALKFRGTSGIQLAIQLVVEAGTCEITNQV